MTDVAKDAPGVLPRQNGILGAVERLGNRLPDPVMIFVWLIALLMLLSALGAALGWSASIAYSGQEAPLYGELANGVLTYSAASLFCSLTITLCARIRKPSRKRALPPGDGISSWMP